MKEEIPYQIRKSVEEGDIENAIDILRKNVLFFNEKENDNISIISQRYNLLKSDINSSLTKEEQKAELISISKSVLHLSKQYNLGLSKNVSKSQTEDNIIQLKSFSSTIDDLIKTVNINEDSLNLHLEDITSWCNIINFKDIKKAKITDRIYVDLDYYVVPRRRRIQKNSNSKINLDQIWEQCESHLILLGEPGAGKTTTIKKIALQYLDRNDQRIKSFPLIIRLRELNGNKDEDGFIIQKVASILGINYSRIKSEFGYLASEFLDRKLLSAIDKLGIMILLDGFDEIKLDFKKTCLAEIQTIARVFKYSKLVL